MIATRVIWSSAPAVRSALQSSTLSHIAAAPRQALFKPVNSGQWRGMASRQVPLKRADHFFFCFRYSMNEIELFIVVILNILLIFNLLHVLLPERMRIQGKGLNSHYIYLSFASKMDYTLFFL